MPNQEDRPRYSDPGHPYSGSGNRYQNRYSKEGEYHRGDGPFQFPWWAIVIGFVVWWPLGFIFIALNNAMRNGKLGGLERAAREKTRTMDLDVHPVYEQPAYAQPDADASDSAQQKRRKERKKAKPKKESRYAQQWFRFGHGPSDRRHRAAGGRSAGPAGESVLAAGCSVRERLAVSALPAGRVRAGAYDADRRRRLPVRVHTVRTNRRMRKKIDNIVGDAKYMPIEDIAAAIPCSYDKCCKYLENCIDDGVFGPEAYLDMHARCLVVEGKVPEPAPEPVPEPAPVAKEKISTRAFWMRCAVSMMPSPMRR